MKTDLMYWLALLLASTLGTTLGDFTSKTLHMGNTGGSLALGSMLVVILVTKRKEAR